MSSNSKSYSQKIAKREKFWCQMCRKQCQDQNGFDMHCQSRSHCEAMAVFAKNPEKYIREFSDDFRTAFLEILKEKHGGREVKVAVIYNQYIASDSQGTRLNATRWETLRDFIDSLGEDNLCRVWDIDDPAQGGKVQCLQLVDKTAEMEHRKMMAKREREAQRRHADEAELQAECVRRHAAINGLAGNAQTPSDDPAPLPLQQMAAAAPMTVKLALPKVAQAEGTNVLQPGKAAKRPLGSEARGQQGGEPQAEKKRRVEEDVAIDTTNTPWVCPGIVVKVVNQKLSDGRFHNKKGVVEETSAGGFVAHVRITDPPALVKLDQAHLQTVIPKIGGRVVIVAGPQKGTRGEIVEVKTDKFTAVVQGKGGARHSLPYEAFSKEAPR